MGASTPTFSTDSRGLAAFPLSVGHSVPGFCQPRHQAQLVPPRIVSGTTARTSTILDVHQTRRMAVTSGAALASLTT